MNNLNDLPTVYNPKETEDKIYKFWEDNGFFKADANSPKPSYSMVIPPPNVTGVLHMGHALDETLQDILIRYHRMCGYETLWVPGTDHAGIATQNVVEKQLRAKCLSRYDLGREKFLEKTWEWANAHKSRILDQCKRLGASFDRSRERFTFDKGCSDAVKEVFVRLYEKGLIYKGKYIVNWCPRCRSAISDVETEYATEQGHLWEISYPLKNESGAIIVATTRPETIFGDVAIAVHPDDKKYSELVGKTVVIPLSGREIPIIADEYVDRNFGTGAVKITPAHDPNDYEVGKRHGLKPIWVIDEDAKMIACGDVPQKYHGMDRYEARKAIVKDLEDQKFLLRVKDHEHNVGKCQRCGTTIEPLLSEQWFVKMKPLAQEAIAAVKDGRIKFVPERWTKNYLDWMENIRDWCISRQLWWGHQIPAYHNKQTGEMIVAKENPDPNVWEQETDVLDTWFSSALWPFETMGWPNTDSPDYKKFYPTNTLVTGFDIIFFWVARMITMGLEFTGKAPFSTVYIHGLVRDEKGQKMSKTKGNTIDPVEIIEKYGCDALRFTMASLCTYGGQDIKISDERFEYGRNFANKIWNASRFVLMNLDGIDNKDIDFSKLTIADKWILDKLNNVAKEVNSDINNYRIGEIAHILYDFFRDSYCDWYVEIAKIQLKDEAIKLNTQRVLRYVLDMSLRLLHPIMPHITEEVWQLIPKETDIKAIMLAPYPQYCDKLSFPKEAKEMALVFETITSLRNVRQSFNIPMSLNFDIQIQAPHDEKAIFEEIESYVKRMARVNTISYIDENSAPSKSATAIVSASKIYIPLKGLIDFDQEIQRQNKKLNKLLTEKKSLQGRINNPKFVSSAPKELVDQTKGRIEEIEVQENAINSLIKSLQD
ncbi:MAG: valine--tRNA ligase [Cyanobacteriota bacterium]|nr:valine--tRNA ligase [Cyanobacteriota bacterium]MDY6359362.1 valine--tRNA ligase [Cyanobacteriota bacterium]MDY6363904.1 valine--tRNA ligase [Cyanobacteriota bacterium]MDY6383327.1 valine--tRNA ligase [Cyanobacteriota bacterium]